ncbi:hypothetical protein BGZ46_001250 [Entomortierella lignicola]|nr:hypothetical protein BGZ46_001250 [Entomortierella lignicola]
MIAGINLAKQSKQAVVGLAQKRFAHDLIVSPKTGRTIIKTGGGGRSSSNGHVITVFGCTGFLGRYLINRLAREGAHIIVPYRDEDDMRHLKVMGDLGKIVPMEIHLRNKDSLEAAIRHSDTVYNLLGRDYETRNFSFADVHVEAAGILAELAQKHDIDRFIQVSALNATVDSNSKFLSTKAQGEELVRSIFPSATIVRPSFMYGQEDRFLARLAMSRGLSIRIDGGNTKVRPVNVSDVAGAMHKMLDGENTVGETFELVGDQEYTYKELLDFIKEITNLDIGDVNIPKPVASLVAKAMNLLPWQTLGADEVERMMINDKLTGVKTFADLDLEPTSLEITGIQYLRRFRTNLYNDEPLKKGVVGKKKTFHTSYLTKTFGFSPNNVNKENIGNNKNNRDDTFGKHCHHNHIYNIMSADQSSQNNPIGGSDHPKYRIGGFQADEPNNKAAMEATLDFGANQGGWNPNANLNLNEGPSEPSGLPSTAESTADAKSEEEQLREKRQLQFRELVKEGIIDPNHKDAQPGKQYTLPVVKPKLM